MLLSWERSYKIMSELFSALPEFSCFQGRIWPDSLPAEAMEKTDLPCWFFSDSLTMQDLDEINSWQTQIVEREAALGQRAVIVTLGIRGCGGLLQLDALPRTAVQQMRWSLTKAWRRK